MKSRREFMRLFIIGLVLVAVAAPVMAQDPGVPDTVRIDTSVVFDTSNQAALSVWLINDEPLSGIQIPLSFSTDLAFLDSVTFGTRTAGFTGADVLRASTDLGGTAQTIMLALVPLQTGSIAAGNDAIATLHFSRNLASASTEAVVSQTTLTPAGGLLAGDTASQPNSYVPTFRGGSAAVGVSVADHPDILPRTFELLPNYPNPFNPTTSFAVAIPVPSHVTLDIYNLLGQRIVRLYDATAPAGYLDLTWNGKDSRGRQVGSGVYFYKVEAKDFRQVRKMVLLK
jgi:hypothetical protein